MNLTESTGGSNKLFYQESAIFSMKKSKLKHNQFTKNAFLQANDYFFFKMSYQL